MDDEAHYCDFCNELHHSSDCWIESATGSQLCVKTQKGQKRKWYLKNRDEVIRKTTEYNRKFPDAHYRNVQNSLRRHPHKRREYVKRRRSKIDLFKHCCRQLVYHALKTGRLIKDPCAHCGVCNDVQAHHTDYMQPLRVLWLCKRCHDAEHRRIKRNGETINGQFTSIGI